MNTLLISFIILLIITLILYFVVSIEKIIALKKQKLKKDEILENNISSIQSNIDSNKKETNDSSNCLNGIIINPKSFFELTIKNSCLETVATIKSILDDNSSNSHDKTLKLLPIFAVSNIRIKEIEDYRESQGEIYFNYLNHLIKQSNETMDMNADKKEWLTNLKKKSVKDIYERAEGDLILLFEFGKENYVFDSELIRKYGFDNLQSYIKEYSHSNGPRIIKSNDYDREKYENLVQVNLAATGQDIPLDLILNSLNLNELNKILKKLSKDELRRKNAAIDLIMKSENFSVIIEEIIPINDIFLLRDLPEDMLNVDITKLRKAFYYLFQMVKMFVITYSGSKATATLLANESLTCKGYKVFYSSRIAEESCSCALDLSSETYSTTELPRIPYHVGCTCSLRPIY
jgi:hypothetical protein